MNPRDYDPAGSLEYLVLLDTSLNVFRDVRSHGDFVGHLGQSNLMDLTEVPEYAAMEAAVSLPAGFTQRVYQFRDPGLGHGVMDVAFRGIDLVNIRAQLFFRGWFPNAKARKFLVEALLPWFRMMFGDPIRMAGPGYYVFESFGLVAMAGHFPQTGSVTATFTDAPYA